MSAVELNTHLPHPARIYDYLLGGKDNYQADRDAAAELLAASPNAATAMRANRNFMVRVARYLAAERGIRQFLDIGTGLPTSPNLHEVVQGVAPSSRVVYVDNDPIVLVHARALLTSAAEGRTAYLDADLRDVDAVLGAPEVVGTVDLSEPVGLCLIAILHFLTDEEQVRRILERLVSALAPGSLLAISILAGDVAEEVARGSAVVQARGIPFRARTRAEVERYFAGLELVDPGVVLVNRWRPDEAARQVADSQALYYGGAAVKP